MHYHLILTEKCNSQCRYCYEKSMQEFDNGLQEKFEFDFNVPADSEVTPEQLNNFLEEGDTLIFYGGEPLIQLEKIKEFIDKLKTKKIKFCMQTNAKLLDKLPEEYLRKFSKILISIDGDKERTDYNRGKGTYDLVLKNLQQAKKIFKGEFVARMTLSQETPDIFDQLQHLIGLNLFDSHHWQIDAGFYKNDFNKKEFTEFAEQYNNQITKLADFWIQEMEKGNVLKFYPFLGIFETLYKNQPSKLPCGSGYANYTITPNGKLTACPIMNNIKSFYCGDLKSNKTEIKKFDVIEPCTECNYLKICGGRCLYSNHAKLWPQEGQDLVCKTITHLIETIKSKIPEIKELISEGKIKESQFEFEKYFGPEIIP